MVFDSHCRMIKDLTRCLARPCLRSTCFTFPTAFHLSVPVVLWCMMQFVFLSLDWHTRLLRAQWRSYIFLWGRFNDALGTSKKKGSSEIQAGVIIRYRSEFIISALRWRQNKNRLHGNFHSSVFVKRSKEAKGNTNFCNMHIPRGTTRKCHHLMLPFNMF